VVQGAHRHPGELGDATDRKAHDSLLCVLRLEPHVT
jgi:hypothetical protein